MRVIAAIEPIPDATAEGAPGPSREIVVDVADVREGIELLKDRVPDGWRMISVRRDAY